MCRGDGPAPASGPKEGLLATDLSLQHSQSNADQSALFQTTSRLPSRSASALSLIAGTPEYGKWSITGGGEHRMYGHLGNLIQT